jgi:hypothetical protein
MYRLRFWTRRGPGRPTPSASCQRQGAGQKDGPQDESFHGHQLRCCGERSAGGDESADFTSSLIVSAFRQPLNHNR